MRVLLVCYRDDHRDGGSWRVGQTLARALLAEGVDVHGCFAYGPRGPIGAEHGPRAHYLGLAGSTDVRRWPRYRSLLRTLRPDVVHYVDAVFWMHAASLGLRSAVPFREVVHVHTTFWEPQRRIDALAWRLLRMQADVFACISDAARDAVIRQGIAPMSRTAVVHNAIDVDHHRQRPDRGAARRLLNVPADPLMVGMACRLVPWKGGDDLVRVLTCAPGWHAMMAGDGPDRSRIEQLAVSLGIRDRVWLTGALEDVRTAYAAMDAFAMLSLNEPFGLAIAEAMASRVPVFGLAGGGEYRDPAWPLVTPDNAVFVERRRRTVDEEEDPAVVGELAQRLVAFGRDPGAHTPMVDAAWATVRDRFGMQRQARAMMDVYRHVCHR